jgi:N-acetylglucosamine-6-sulfatase
MLDAQGIKVCDETYYHRLGNIAAIDEMVSQLIGRLDAHGILNNTYIIYTTDNGFHIGNHRLHPGKRCPYEEDINIPLLIRGPNVPKDVVSTHVNSHTDMAPTIMQMLQLDGSGHQFDGSPIPYANESMLSSAPASTKTELVNVEFWNAEDPHLHYDQAYNNTYKALRLVSGSYSLFYSTWCTGEREFYDMNVDLVQMNNLLGSNATGTGSLYYGRPQSELIPRLDALLMVTKGCKEEACQLPWKVLFPDGQVTELESAMRPEYDAFFAQQPKVSFTYCVPGHIIAEEGPQNVLAFHS